MPQMRYICEQLPHDQASVTKWVKKFVELRLKGLKSDPDSFASTYITEANRSTEEWISILRRPAFSVVTCTPWNEAGNGDVCDRDWIGQLLVYGPKIKHLGDASDKEDFETAHFLSGVYVQPEHRKNNITSLLVESAVKLYRISIPGLTIPITSSPLAHKVAVFNGTVAPRMERLVKYYRSINMPPNGTMSRREFCISYGIPVDETLDDEEIIVLERREKVLTPSAALARL